MKKVTRCCWYEYEVVGVDVVCLHCARVTTLTDVCENCGMGDCAEMDRCDYDPEYDDLHI